MPGIGASRWVRTRAIRTAPHFGRREQAMSSDAVTALIVDQVAFLVELAADAGVPIRFLKPHGALYNQAQRQNAIARGVVDAAAELGLPLLGQPGSRPGAAGHPGSGVRYIAEGFPDRRYRDDGSLVPRSEPDADPARPRRDGGAALESGQRRPGGDALHPRRRPAPFDNARLVRRVLEGQGIGVRSFAADAA